MKFGHKYGEKFSIGVEMKLVTNYLKIGRDPGWIELFFDLSFVVIYIEKSEDGST